MILIENINLTAMVTFLNHKFKKENGNDFNVSDCQQYIRRGYLPKYLGDYTIQKMEGEGYKYVKLYRIVKNDI